MAILSRQCLSVCTSYLEEISSRCKELFYLTILPIYLLTAASTMFSGFLVDLALFWEGLFSFDLELRDWRR